MRQRAGREQAHLGPGIRTTFIDFQYKIKNAAEPQERVAEEGPLSRVA